MAKLLQALLLIVCISLVLAASTRKAQARPVPSIPPVESTIDITNELQLQAVGSEVQTKHADLIMVPVNKDSAEEDVEEKFEDVCTELGPCYDKRLLAATIDYTTEGPNNPITDPPH